MANSSGSISFLRRRALRLPVALVIARRSSAQSPAAAQQRRLEVHCAPNTFQPDVWVVSECTTHITNNTQEVAPAGYLSVSSDGTFDGPLPNYFWMWNIADGEYAPVGGSDLSFEGASLQPGQSTESHLVGLLRMSEGTWRGEDTLFSGDREVVTIPLQLVAKADATAPPQDLLLVKKLVAGETADGAPSPTATYETAIANVGLTIVTSLTMTDRADFVDLVEAQPAPATRNDEFHLVTWDLASFGKESLAPGESIVVRTTYGPLDHSGCSYVSSGVVVEAEVDGRVERYGTRPEEEALVGDCDYESPAEGAGRSASAAEAKALLNRRLTSYGRRRSLRPAARRSSAWRRSCDGGCDDTTPARSAV